MGVVCHPLSRCRRPFLASRRQMRTCHQRRHQPQPCRLPRSGRTATNAATNHGLAARPAVCSGRGSPRWSILGVAPLLPPSVDAKVAVLLLQGLNQCNQQWFHDVQAAARLSWLPLVLEDEAIVVTAAPAAPAVPATSATLMVLLLLLSSLLP